MLRRLLVPMIVVPVVCASLAARADEVIVVHDHWDDPDYWSSPFAHAGSFGIGVGTTSLVTGLTAKVYLARFVAIEATGGWWYSEGPVINGDLVFELPTIIRGRNASLNWNIGGGGSVGFPVDTDGKTREATLGGVDGVLGLALQLRPVPFEFVFDLRPTYIIGNNNGDWNGFYLGAGGAVRFFFW